MPCINGKAKDARIAFKNAVRRGGNRDSAVQPIVSRAQVEGAGGSIGLGDIRTGTSQNLDSAVDLVPSVTGVYARFGNGRDAVAREADIVAQSGADGGRHPIIARSHIDRRLVEQAIGHQLGPVDRISRQLADQPVIAGAGSETREIANPRQVDRLCGRDLGQHHADDAVVAGKRRGARPFIDDSGGLATGDHPFEVKADCEIAEHRERIVLQVKHLRLSPLVPRARSGDARFCPAPDAYASAAPLSSSSRYLRLQIRRYARVLAGYVSNNVSIKIDNQTASKV